MNNSPYNLLPSNIKRKYQIIYSELIHPNITLFKNASGKWGVITIGKRFGIFPGYKYLIDPVFDSVGFNKNLELIEAVKYENNTWSKDKNVFYYFNTDGDKIWESEKGTQVTIDKFKNIRICRLDKYGMLNENFETLIEPVYERLNAINIEFFIALKNGYYGIVDRNNKTILDFEFIKIFDTTLNNKVIVRDKSDKYFSFDLKNIALTPLPFDEILSATSNTYKAPSPESYSCFKSIINRTERDKFEEDEIIKYNGDWGIIKADGTVKIPNEYTFIDFLRNPKYFKVSIGELKFSYFEDEEGNSRCGIENAKWGIIDSNNKIIVPIEYDWINEVESTIWTVYNGGKVFYNDDYQEDYWTIKGGKLGVYNLDKLIIPIEYDTIKTTWFRIKDYIFVQKGTQNFDENLKDYDVFTVNGEKIEFDKPKPGNHNNNE